MFGGMSHAGYASQAGKSAKATKAEQKRRQEEAQRKYHEQMGGVLDGEGSMDLLTAKSHGAGGSLGANGNEKEAGKTLFNNALEQERKEEE